MKPSLLRIKGLPSSGAFQPSAWLLALTALALCVVGASAQLPFQVIKSFGNPRLSGANPWATPIEGADGALYGTTEDGGSVGYGTVFKVNRDGTGYTVLKSFTLTGGDGGLFPFAGLVQGSDGALYGTTFSGVAGPGTVFKLNTDGTGYTVLYSFTGTGGDGAYPKAALVQGSDGALYGTTWKGGSAGQGTVFKLNTDGSHYTVLRSFTGSGGDGAYPTAALVQGSDGALYGATYQGGSAGYGTVFRLNLDATGYAVLKSFTGTGNDGIGPQALVQGSDGALYGMTMAGGSANHGTVFKLKTDGTGYKVLTRFTGGSGDGALSRAGVIQAKDGALYGTTFGGGSVFYGTVFKLNADGTGYTVLHSFTGTGGDGSYTGVIQGSDGALYGTTSAGGSANAGTLFKLNPDGTGYSVLLSFNPYGGDDGYAPRAGLVQGTDGELYGTTYAGGTANAGTVFKLNPDGMGYTVLKSFTGTGSDGRNPTGLVLGSDGALYGKTEADPVGSAYHGTLFKLKTDGTGYTVLRTGGPGDGSYTGVVQGNDGALYGTTPDGGSAGSGTVFKLNTDGTGYMVLKSFTGTGDDGYAPRAGLVQGSDGALYGTTDFGGSAGYGTVFKLNPDGTGYTVLKSFTGTGDGAHPAAALVQVSDGALYGTTSSGDVGFGGAYGTVFKLKTDGTGYTVLRTGNDSDGWGYTSVVQGNDGALYGTTPNGGSAGAGTVFKLNTDGTGYMVLASFTRTGGDGSYPQNTLIQGNDGAFYGTTSDGGDMGIGIVYRLGTPAVRPIPGAFQIGTVQNTTASVPVANVLATAKSPSGGALSIVSLSPASAGGGVVSLSSGTITYTPSGGFIGSDSFTYILSDGAATARGTINVTVTSSNVPPANVISITVTAVSRTVVFAGIPGRDCVIQSASAATGPWLDLSPPIAAAANGMIQYSDTTNPMPSARFYRTRTSP